MTSRRWFLKRALAVTVALPVAARSQASDFESFQSQQRGDFSDYQDDIAESFAQYQEAIQEAFDEYRGRVRSRWGDEEIGSATRYVDYDEDLGSRVMVDFEQAELDVEVIVPEEDTDQAEDKARNKLKGTASKTIEDARHTDPLNQAINARLRQKDLVESESEQAGSESVVGDVITGESSPDQAEVDRAVDELEPEVTERSAPESGMRIVNFSVTLDAARISNKSDQYLAEVREFSEQEDVDPALVLAIMHSESSFNPMARSHIPAFGLMQIVPESAGRDATEKVYGKQRVLSPDYLYNADNNIRMGCAYLNILMYRYLQSIENEESRVYCAIAAYNTGAGNVARTFTGNTSMGPASRRINSMSPDQVFQTLVQKLPYEETRNYMQKVTPRYKAYQEAV